MQKMILLLVLFIHSVWSIVSFPNAEGFGANSIGGRGGSVVFVTNLNDSGPGSLRDVLGNANGPTTVLFSVAGVILLRSPILVLSKSFLTIAGQTAFGKGIELRAEDQNPADSSLWSSKGVTNQVLFFQNCDHLIIRYIRIRCSVAEVTHKDIHSSYQNGLKVYKSNNVIVDHVSIAFTSHIGIFFESCINVTMQYSISGDGRQRVKDDASRRIYISGVGLEYVDNGSFHHNYVPHCYNSWYGETICSTELMANIFYNWQYFGPRIREDNPTTCKANVIRNAFVRGDTTSPRRPLILPDEGEPSMYVWENIDIVGGFKGNLEPPFPEAATLPVRLLSKQAQLVRWWNIATANFNDSSDFLTGLADRKLRLSEKAVFPTSVPITLPDKAEDLIDADGSFVKQVGCALPYRDSVDKILIEQLISRTGKVNYDMTNDPDYDDYSTVENGATVADRDSDGLPDVFEDSFGSDIDPNKVRADGYTLLEEYLASLTHFPIGFDSQQTNSASQTFDTHNTAPAQQSSSGSPASFSSAVTADEPIPTVVWIVIVVAIVIVVLIALAIVGLLLKNRQSNNDAEMSINGAAEMQSLHDDSKAQYINLPVRSSSEAMENHDTKQENEYANIFLDSNPEDDYDKGNLRI